MQLTSDQAADRLSITGGALRQIETNTKPVSLQLAFRAEELYRQVDETLTVDDLLVAEQQPPQPEPQPQPKQPAEPKVEPTAPPRRQDRPGPPRVTSSVSAGAA